ncbi:MAG: hypothetical protein M0P95_17950 [Sulfuritalea sp.]|jgi:hypothetical protein|nr:hypothetical protein [Sulfuritalea sp.]
MKPVQCAAHKRRRFMILRYHERDLLADPKRKILWLLAQQMQVDGSSCRIILWHHTRWNVTVFIETVGGE